MYVYGGIVVDIDNLFQFCPEKSARLGTICSSLRTFMKIASPMLFRSPARAIAD